MKPAAGDTVEVHTKDEKLRGLFIPRPDVLSQDILVLKLETGYNIGIDTAKIKKITVVKKAEKLEPVVPKTEHNPDLPTVAVLSFGGTISSKVDYKTGGVIADYTADDFVQMMPQLSSIANLRAKRIGDLMSEDHAPKEYVAMAEAIANELVDPDVDGVVLTQGTDTLHYSAAALSFFLQNLNKPVVLTASQRSIDRGSSDAFMNLVCAVRAASSDIAHVMTCMHGTTNDDYCILINGTKVRKMHTSRRDAFRPINDIPIAKVFPDKQEIEYVKTSYNKRTDKRPKLNSKFEKNIALVQWHPGLNPDILDYYLTKGIKGIVFAATAMGHLPTIQQGYSVVSKLKKVNEQGIPLIIASQTLYGSTYEYVYSAARTLSLQTGATYVGDMMPEVALMKLGWVLGQTKDLAEVQKMMKENYAGEYTDILTDDMFLN